MKATVFFTCAALLLCTAPAGAREHSRRDPPVEAGQPGVALEGDALLVALPLENRGDEPVRVAITRLELHRRKLLSPAALPLDLGAIAPGERGVAQLAFARAGLEPEEHLLLLVEGRIVEGRRTRHFSTRALVRVPRPEGRRAVRTFEVAVRHTGDPTPPDETPLELENVNEEPGPPLPIGRATGEVRPANPSQSIARVLADRNLGPQALKANDPVTFARLATIPLAFADTKGGGPADPSGASVDVKVTTGGLGARIVFLTGNLYGLLSTDGGATFTHIDPTTLFNNIPADGLPADQGICCDMNMIYVPAIDRFVWMIQTKGSAIPANPVNSHFNRLRVAFASSAQVLASGGKAWSYFDMTTASFGLTSNIAFFDYPSIAYSKASLTMSVGVPNIGFLLMRVPLADLVSGPTIHIGSTNPADSNSAYGSRLAQDVPDGAYWFGQPSTTQLTAFEWLDGAGFYSWHTVSTEPWSNATYTSLCPDGTNWLGAFTSAVRGAAFAGDTTSQGVAKRRLVLAWNAAGGGAFPQPYVRVVRMVRTGTGAGATWSAEPAQQIWNPNFAFQFAELSANTKGEIGVSMTAGGGGSNPTPAAGFLGDSTFYVVNSSQVSTGRWGDYTAIRRHAPDGRWFSVSNYYLNAQGAEVAQYVMFGRAADLPAP